MNWVENPNGDKAKDYPQGPELDIPQDYIPIFQSVSYELTLRGLTERVILPIYHYPRLRYSRRFEKAIKIILPEENPDLVLDVAGDLIVCIKNNNQITPEEWQRELDRSIDQAVESRGLQERNHMNRIPNPYIPLLTK